MNRLIIFILALSGAYLYLTWKPSTSGIANEIRVGEAVTYQGEVFDSDWAARPKEIQGYLRRKDRHFDEHMPIITYDLVLTSGEYGDPDIVEIRHKGGGNYTWSARKQPEGTLVVYHTVPTGPDAQDRLDQIDEGDEVTLVGRISLNSEIKRDAGGYVKLLHDNHKFILVEGATAR